MDKSVVELDKEFMKAVAICKNKYGYNPTRFLQMLEENVPIDTAILLVPAPGTGSFSLLS